VGKSQRPNAKSQRKAKQTIGGRTKKKYQAISDLGAAIASLVFLWGLML
jgi:hypothetical protein